VRLLTRTGHDWTHKYPAIAAAVSSLGARQAYLDGELCGVGPDGITSFSIIQLASDDPHWSSAAFIGCGPNSSWKSKYLTWTGDNLLRQVVYEGLREDKPASEVRREVPNAKPDASGGTQ
jgi:ATP-dependent DNA ligase